MGVDGAGFGGGGRGLLMPAMGQAKNRACVSFHLKTDDGKIINPRTGENADQPSSIELP